MISEQVRTAEREIDDRIRQLPIWKSKKNLLLRGLMNLWRDGLDLAFQKFAHSMMFPSSESFEGAAATEQKFNTGVFWCMKWALQYGSSTDGTDPTEEQLVEAVLDVGSPYQLLVDALECAKSGVCEIDIDSENQMLTVYEGGDVSGYDHSIVVRDYTSLLFHKQTPLVEDLDQLTARWTAGTYRKYWLWLRDLAEVAESETVVAQTNLLSRPMELFKRPVVLELPEPPAEFRVVQDDLTLTQDKIDSGFMWKIGEWQDCPLVQIGSHAYGITCNIRALAYSEDHLLRVAVLNDREQYEKVSGLREERMLAACKAAFEAAGWSYQPHFRLRAVLRSL